MTGSPEAIAAALEAEATRSETPCGPGSMVWRRWGAGTPLILLPGGHGSWTHWIRNIPVLARDRSVVIPDLPGEGASAVPPVPITLDEIAGIVIEGLHRVIPGGERFDLAGFSFGGLIGGMIARRLGAQVRNLILVGSAGMGIMKPPRPLMSLRGLVGPEAIAAAHRNNLEILMFANPENIDDLAVYLHSENIRNSRLRDRPSGSNELLRAELPQVQARVHAIWGELDVTAIARLPEYRDFLAGLQPPAELVVIPAAGHWVAYEAAAEVNKLLSAFAVDA